MLSVITTAGLGFDQAMEKVADYWQTTLGMRFRRVLQEMQMGVSRADALRKYAGLSRLRFDNGVASYLEVLYAENELFVARTALITAEFTERFAVYRVLAVTGTLLATLDIPAPREAVTIYRTPADVQTPDAVRAKTPQLRDPRAEPRPLRGEKAGEPPADAPDLSTVLGGRS